MPAREEVSLYLVVVFGSLLLTAAWEFCRPRRRREFPGLRRRLGNIGFWILNLILAALIFEPAARFRPRLEATLGIDFPSWPIADAGLGFVTGFLMLDLLRYLVHRCKHALPFFWRFHALHHSDPDVDVTTSVRQHPIEYLLHSGVFWLAALLLDIPATVLLTYALAVFATDAIQHGNIRLPERLERCLQLVLVTVDMHRIHHSVSFAEGSVNYATVFSIWDRLFGTYAHLTRAQHDSIIFGVHELPGRECLKPSAMMLTPWLIGRARATAGS
jgi:sterol desaturase/sphingolipid hydroxylase (fatty acid hydroxylase superfamily)